EGDGNVAVDPPGGSYGSNSVVTLTAQANAGSVFSGWSGDVVGTDLTVAVTMNGNKQATARFLPTYRLLLSTPGGGTVVAKPAAPSYARNSGVNLTAIPSAGWTFIEWLGDVTGTNSSTTIAVTRDTSAQAIFSTALPTTSAGT